MKLVITSVVAVIFVALGSFAGVVLKPAAPAAASGAAMTHRSATEGPMRTPVPFRDWTIWGAPRRSMVRASQACAHSAHGVLYSPSMPAVRW